MLVCTALIGIAQGSQLDDANDTGSSITARSLVDLNSVFMDADSYPVLLPQKESFNSIEILSGSKSAGYVVAPVGFQHDRQPISNRNRSTSRGSRATQSNEVGSSLVRLVSQQTSGEIASPSSEAQTDATPLYTMQQPDFQLAEGSAYAGPSATRGTWVLIAPFGWVPGINGQVGVGSRTMNINFTPGQALSHISNLDGALMLHAEAGKGDWGIIFDTSLVRASTSVATAPAQVDVTVQQTMFEGLGMYRFVEMPDYFVEGKLMTVDLLAGGRFYEFGNLLTVRPFDPTLPAIPLNLSATWVDLVFGGRARVPVTNSVDLFGRADIGGFGIGSSSTLVWNLIAGADWKINSCSSLVAGYRELNINKSGGGVNGTAFDFNAKLYGPFLAITFQF